MGCEFALPVARSNPTYIGLGPGSEDALPQTSGPRELCIFSISKTFMFEAMSIPVVDLCLPMHKYLDSTQHAAGTSTRRSTSANFFQVWQHID